MLSSNTIIHHHKRKYNQPRMTTTAKINSKQMAAQESFTAAWSEAFPVANVGILLSTNKLRIAIAF